MFFALLHASVSHGKEIILSGTQEVGSACECHLWCDRAGAAYQGLGRLSIFLVQKLKSDFLRKVMAEERVTEVIKRAGKVAGERL